MDCKHLICDIRNGDREAFDLMCIRYYTPLMSYARLFLNGNWAEDVVQDVLVNVWLRREALDPEQSLYGYLLRSVYNKSINYVAKHRHDANYRDYNQEQIESLGYAYYDPDRNPVIEKIYSDEMWQVLNKAIANLPPRCREVFILNYIGGLSHKEISLKLGLAVSTVENHVFLALKALRARLKKKELLIVILLFFFGNNLFFIG